MVSQICLPLPWYFPKLLSNNNKNNRRIDQKTEEDAQLLTTRSDMKSFCSPPGPDHKFRTSSRHQPLGRPLNMSIFQNLFSSLTNSQATSSMPFQVGVGPSHQSLAGHNEPLMMSRGQRLQSMMGNKNWMIEVSWKDLWNYVLQLGSISWSEVVK